MVCVTSSHDASQPSLMRGSHHYPQRRLTSTSRTPTSIFDEPTDIDDDDNNNPSKMKLLVLLYCGLSVASAFVILPTFPAASVSLKATTEQVDSQLEEIAHKLRLNAYDVDTAVYGIESKDPLYGIENIHTKIRMDPDHSLGLELTEVAHSDLDHRGLVLVSKVTGLALHDTPIHVGDTIIGVFVGDDFKESTTGRDYDDTVEILGRAKEYALNHDDIITLELNRVVKKAQVKVVVENDDNTETTLDALAGDNLRLLLMHKHVNLYDETTHRLDQPNVCGNCGGEGICGTCLVSIQEGMEHLNKVGPQESSILTNRPTNWRAACKTVVGADNKPDSTLRIRLHPQTANMEELKP